MSGIDDIDALIEQAATEPVPAGHSALDVLLDIGNDDLAAIEIDDSDFLTLEEEWSLLTRLQARKEKLEDLAEKAKIDYNLQKSRMQRAMADQGTRQFASAEGRGAGSLAKEYRTAVQDPEVFDEWVRANHPELYSINAQTRDSFIRKQYRNRGILPTLEDGSPNPEFPPGLRVTEQDVLRVRGMRPPKQEQEQA
jgi:hypothetical protein